MSTASRQLSGAQGYQCGQTSIAGSAPGLGMTEPQLIGYGDIHCETERALFNERQINRMIERAGFPDGFVREVGVGWYGVHHEMKELVRLARKVSETNP